MGEGSIAEAAASFAADAGILPRRTTTTSKTALAGVAVFLKTEAGRLRPEVSLEHESLRRIGVQGFYLVPLTVASCIGDD